MSAAIIFDSKAPWIDCAPQIPRVLGQHFFGRFLPVVPASVDGVCSGLSGQWNGDEIADDGLPGARLSSLVRKMVPRKDISGSERKASANRARV